MIYSEYLKWLDTGTGLHNIHHTRKMGWSPSLETHPCFEQTPPSEYKSHSTLWIVLTSVVTFQYDLWIPPNVGNGYSSYEVPPIMIYCVYGNYKKKGLNCEIKFRRFVGHLQGYNGMNRSDLYVHFICTFNYTTGDNISRMEDGILLYTWLHYNTELQYRNHAQNWKG